ncbi:Mdm32p KNAG_0B03950 [Huiozyma naganishii CBS 8797]|uniref:Mitochondrial distribution and morphology protein 32 n=1 Tax=Huiozyma naganishii (strain ATCC MYA-139 / BCRC 22969 / CBS 8797 / KCTC 17520 / NBRC 10181 / NCYC 3082 / Yp74L-3) TaxID=1071383 RepID=J7S4V8_HUIN7|nr:hypothetical protein KNAG_0B03950 [Kazachstania naganishii CBS 8797]CCK68836.1 hypothetical protein KNAG_0B03950 [Kazachstania naganishii CBS 8797]
MLNACRTYTNSISSVMRCSAVPWRTLYRTSVTGAIRRSSPVGCRESSRIIQPARMFSSTSRCFGEVKKKVLTDNNSPLLKRSQPDINGATVLQKLKANVKWILIRNKERPFSKNELGTLFSWLLISQLVWLILKTTTVVSILLLGFNTVFAKELVGQTVGKLLNYFLDGIDIKFKDASIPEWQNGFIRFNSVELKSVDDGKSSAVLSFDLKFHQIEMNLSLKKWLFGNGLLNDIKILGMRGDANINYQRDDENRNALLIEWFSNPHYELNKIVVSDSNINVKESFPGSETPTCYKIALFNLEIPKLRLNRMIIDFLNANVITGSINNSLFTFHKRQNKLPLLNSLEDDNSSLQRITRLRLNSISVKDLGIYQTKAFNWIDEGNVDIIADIMLPRGLADTSDSAFKGNEEKYIVIDLKFRFKDLKAILPAHAPKLSTGESIVSLEELKPVVSYVNLQRALSQTAHKATKDSNPPEDGAANDNRYHIGNETPNISIRRRKSYPNITVIQSTPNSGKKNASSSVNFDDSNQRSIIKFNDSVDDSTGQSTQFGSANIPSNELSLRCRIVKNVKDLEEKMIFQETGIYDQLSMELYVDLTKVVEEWEYKNKDQWMKQWGTGFASQLLLFGFASPV